MSVLIARHPLYERHDTGPGHPERPSRLGAVVAGIRAAGLEEVLVEFEPEPAPRELVLGVHPGAYLERLETLVLTGGRHVDADTVIGADSLDAAMVAAGAGLGAIERLDRGEATAAFCAVRPPGHHATRATAMGFCLVNNVAVAARALADRGERVLIVDIDAHHGNGTQDVFYDDPRVMFVSFHEYPLYPGTGRLDEVGEGIGLGTTLNLPFPAHTTGDVYRHALDRLVLPAAEAFGPTWLLVSAGFDGHRRDPLTGLGLTSGDFADMTRELLTLAPPGRRLFFLEGGYDLQALSDSVGAVLAELAGVQFRPEAPSSGGPGESVVGAAREWHERAMDIGPSDLSAPLTVIGVPGADPDDLAWLLDVCRPIAERFVGAGHEILLVGGAVRDLATGRDVRRPDLDLTTDARPPETLRLLDGWVDAVWRQGERFGTIGARRGDHELEVTTFRAEAYDPDSRKPTVTFGDRVEDDLARRDFTVNAMALRLPDGELVDPHDGLSDLAARRLRTPLAPEVSFSDDPLRMLRAARFAAGYGLDPDPTVVAAARALAGRMDIVSIERIHDELTKLLRLPDPAAGLRFLVATDLAGHTLPELAAAERDVLDGACAAVAAVPWDPERGPDALLRLVVLLVALDPAAMGAAGPSAAGHRIGGRLAALRHSAVDTARGRHVGAGAAAALAGVDTDARAREVLAAAGTHASDVLVAAASLVGLPGTDAVPAAVERLARVLASEPDLVALAPELRGDEVMARYGIGSGPEVGRALAAVRAARLAEGPLGDERAWEVVDGVLGDGSGPSDT